MMDNIFDMLLNEDSLTVKSTSSASSNDDNKPKNYGEYLDAQVKSAQNRKVDFSKADDNKRKSIAKGYATIAKSKFDNLQGLPKNDNEADNMLKASINKNAMDQSSNDSSVADQAEKEVEELTNSLIEQTMLELSEDARCLVESYKSLARSRIYF